MCLETLPSSLSLGWSLALSKGLVPTLPRQPHCFPMTGGGRRDFSLDTLSKRADTGTGHGTEGNEAELKSTETKYWLIQLHLADRENLKSHNVSALFSSPYNEHGRTGTQAPERPGQVSF